MSLKDELHQVAMNTPCCDDQAAALGEPSPTAAYRIGHRDARHAIAEQILAHDFGIEKLERERDAHKRMADSRLTILRNIAMLNATDPQGSKEYAAEVYGQHLRDESVPVMTAEVLEYIKHCRDLYPGGMPAQLDHTLVLLERVVRMSDEICCAFCGWKTAKADRGGMIEHIASCDTHPLRLAAALNEALVEDAEAGHKILDASDLVDAESDKGEKLKLSERIQKLVYIYGADAVR